MAHDVFICHSSKDRTIANAICATLEQHRIRCWMAPRDVLPGSDYATSIVEAVSGTRLTILVFSDRSNQSPHVRREIERTVSRGIPILPFRVEDVVPSPSLEYFISDAHWLDALTPPLERHLEQLVIVVQALLASLPTTHETAPAAGVDQVASPPEPAPETAWPPAAPGSLWTMAKRRPRMLIAGIVGAGCLAVLGLVGAFALAPSNPAATSPSSASASPSSAPPSPSPTAPAPSQEVRLVAESALATGDCLLTPDQYADNASDQYRFWNTSLGTWPSSWGVVHCDQPHGAEVFFLGDVWGPEATFPGDDALDGRWNTQCTAEFQRYVGIALSRSVLDMSGWTGYGADGWAQGLRDISCIAYDRGGADLQGSIRGTGR